MKERTEPSSRSTLIPIPLPSSTLLLTYEEALHLLESLEAALPHTDQFEVAGEELSREEMVVLMDDLQAILLAGRPRLEEGVLIAGAFN